MRYKNFIIKSLLLFDTENYETFKKSVISRVRKIINEDIVLCGKGDNCLPLNILKEKDMHIICSMFLQNKN